MCLDHQFDKLEGATQQGVPFDIEPSPQPMLFRALLAVPSGEAVYGAPVARRIVAFTGAHQQYAAQVVPELTEREREVLELVAA
jgi:DNA-binding NarL/FixJ family response regulator